LTDTEIGAIIYIDRMVYKVGDMVRVKHLSSIDVRADKVPEHRIGLIVSRDQNNNEFYDVKFGEYTEKFHYSHLRSLSIKSCQGGTK